MKTDPVPSLSTLHSYHTHTTAADMRPKKRFRADMAHKDKFNISNDQYYEVSKDGGRHRVRQTFGQLSVEHAYPAQKLQLPFVRVLSILYFSFC